MKIEQSMKMDVQIEILLEMGLVQILASLKSMLPLNTCQMRVSFVSSEMLCKITVS